MILWYCILAFHLLYCISLMLHYNTAKHSFFLYDTTLHSFLFSVLHFTHAALLYYISLILCCIASHSCCFIIQQNIYFIFMILHHTHFIFTVHVLYFTRLHCSVNLIDCITQVIYTHSGVWYCISLIVVYGTAFHS